MRLRRLLHRRHLVFAALVGMLGRLLKPKNAYADFFGGDVAVLTAILTQAVATVSNLASMLSNLREQLSAAHTMLSKLDGASFDSVLGIINSTDLSLAALTADVTSIGYTLQSVNSQFRSLYPTSYSTTAFAQFDSMYGRWEDEILASTQVAARSQATLSTLESTAREAASIVADSRGSDGAVAQMQSIVQMLGLMQSQNASVIQSLATTGRVLTATAATSASERQLSREKKRRHLAGYRDRGTPVPPMTMP
jgi:conjugal transfer/entry exclusion protein